LYKSAQIEQKVSVIYLLKQKVESLQIKCRAILFSYFFKNLNIVIGRNLRIRGGNGLHSFGNKLIIYDNVVFEVYNKMAKISVGNNCIVSYGVIFSCSKRIEIGDNVWIGEYVSIRDSTHEFSASVPLGSGSDLIANIKIGDNVWIGRGSIILPGTVIGDNVVIGANSLVKGNLDSNSMYAGTPARLKKKLETV
jgi:acetyltransferase-like isoleucine patch superfamily enzyme